MITFCPFLWYYEHMEDLRFASSVHIMIYLAEAYRKGGDLISSAQLADGLNANPALVRKLMGPLVEAGLVETVKGKAGGAKLAKPPKSITLKDIYLTASDREIAFCRENVNAKCPISHSMKKLFSNIADGMEKALHTHLNQTTLEKLLKDC